MSSGGALLQLIHDMILFRDVNKESTTLTICDTFAKMGDRPFWSLEREWKDLRKKCIVRLLKVNSNQGNDVNIVYPG